MAAKVTFDPDNLLVLIKTGITAIDVTIDLYSDWKEDFQSVANLNKVPPVFVESIGGNNLGGGQNLGSFFIFNNAAGWRFKPPEEDIETVISGNLYANDTTLAIMVPPDGNFKSFIILQRAIDTITLGGSFTDQDRSTLRSLQSLL